ncbi:MAG: hypothetical protein GY828_08610 [Candidatus Gracilibacteria bacterium]|nr:hypothetical protein [Candidatus Gracilibacteria bacterium]
MKNPKKNYNFIINYSFLHTHIINKILIFGGLALSAILVVENMVIPTQAFVFLSRNSTTWMLSIVSILIGIAIGVGIKGILSDNKEDTGDDFNF